MIVNRIAIFFATSFEPGLKNMQIFEERRADFI